MRFPRMIVLLALALLLLAAGCSNNNDGGNAGNDREATPAPQETPSDTQQPPDTGEGGAADGDAVMEEFDKLTASGASPADLLDFMSEHRTQVEPEQMTVMVIALEQAQHDQSPELEERYYTEEGVQEKLFALYTQQFVLPKADEVEDEALKRLLQDSEEAGYKLETTEGAFFPVIDYERYREFQAHATADMQAYIDIMALESNVAAVKDAALMIEWPEVIERALSMERFMRDYPDSDKFADIDNLLNNYIYITFKGIDNTPLFAYGDDTISPEVKAAFTAAVGGGTDGSDYLTKVKSFVELVEKNGDRKTEEVIKFQDDVTAGLWD